MRHKHAEFIKAWVESMSSVEAKADGGAWVTFINVREFDNQNLQFRHTPKPEYWYLAVTRKTFENGGHVSTSVATKSRNEYSAIRMSYVEGKLTAVELLVDGDGK